MQKLNDTMIGCVFPTSLDGRHVTVPGISAQVISTPDPGKRVPDK